MRASAPPWRRTFVSSSSSTVSTTAHAAAHATGLPPNVLAWSPGSNATGSSSATSSAPIGKPLASPFASVTASGFVPRRCHAKKLPVRPTPVCTSSNTSKAPCSSAMSRARARNSGRAGWMPPSPCTGSMRMHAVSSSTTAASDAESLSFAKRTPGNERLEGSALRGLSRNRERTERAAVERVLQRDDVRLAGRLARVLDRRLDGLRAGVAEEGVRAAEALGEQLREAHHRLRPVEVRDVP